MFMKPGLSVLLPVTDLLGWCAILISFWKCVLSVSLHLCHDCLLRSCIRTAVTTDCVRAHEGT